MATRAPFTGLAWLTPRQRSGATPLSSSTGSVVPYDVQRHAVPRGASERPSHRCGTAPEHVDTMSAVPAAVLPLGTSRHSWVPRTRMPPPSAAGSHLKWGLSTQSYTPTDAPGLRFVLPYCTS